jgi:glutamyl-tRNA synthetase
MVRTRFAPSPTGFLHIGSVRTALFSWAFARHHSGQFILRIEDTDQVRSTEESIQAILNGMNYLGLEYDEGPFYQSQRFDRYKTVLKALLQSGDAYHCYCSKERLENMRAEQEKKGEKPRYDGHCRPNLGKIITSNTANAPVIRFKNPLIGSVVWDDLVKGRIEISNGELDDLVISRFDGVPTYNFCVVVDDWDMNISHVIRGDDHVNNTPRQINILKALNAPLPYYAHLPMIFNALGQKMSKRRDTVNILDYDELGFLPEALLNYLARLGWGHGDDEFFSMTQFCQWFDLKHVQSAPSRFDNEKLLWLNAQHIKKASNARLKKLILNRLTLPDSLTIDPDLEAVIALVKSRAQDIHNLAKHCYYFYKRAVPSEEDIAHYLTPISVALLQKFAKQLEALNGWTKENIHQQLELCCSKEKIKMSELGMPLRIQVCGVNQTPSIDAVLALIGKKETLYRMKQPFI